MPSRDFREYSVDLDSAEGLGMFRSRSSNSMQSLGAHITKFSERKTKQSQSELDIALNVHFGAAQVMSDHLHSPSQLQLPLPQSVGSIISLSPVATSILYALGVGDRLVGITDACIVPEQANDTPRIVARHSHASLSPPRRDACRRAQNRRAPWRASSTPTLPHGSSYGSLTRLEARQSATHAPRSDRWAYLTSIRSTRRGALIHPRCVLGVH